MLYWKGFCIINEFWCFQCKCLVFRFGSIPDDAFNHKFTPWQGSIKAPIWRKRSHFRGNQMAGCLNTYPTHLHEIAWHEPTSIVPLLCWTSSDVQGFAMRGSTPRVRLRTEVMSLFLSFPSQWMMTVPGWRGMMPVGLGLTWLGENIDRANDDKSSNWEHSNVCGYSKFEHTLFSSHSSYVMIHDIFIILQCTSLSISRWLDFVAQGQMWCWYIWVISMLKSGFKKRPSGLLWWLWSRELSKDKSTAENVSDKYVDREIDREKWSHIYDYVHIYNIDIQYIYTYI